MRLERYDYRLYEMVARLLTLAHGIQYPRGVEEKVLSAIFPPEQPWVYMPNENTIRVRVEEYHCGQLALQYLLVFEYGRDQIWRWSLVPSPQLHDIYENALKRLSDSIKINVCVNPFYYDVDYLAPRTLLEGFMKGMLIILQNGYSVRKLLLGNTKELPAGFYKGDDVMILVEESYGAKCGRKGTFLWWFRKEIDGWTMQMVERPDPLSDEDPLKKIEKQELFRNAVESAGVREVTSLTPWIKTF